jgi:hypothetical protein
MSRFGTAIGYLFFPSKPEWSQRAVVERAIIDAGDFMVTFCLIRNRTPGKEGKSTVISPASAAFPESKRRNRAN